METRFRTYKLDEGRFKGRTPIDVVLMTGKYKNQSNISFLSRRGFPRIGKVINVYQKGDNTSENGIYPLDCKVSKYPFLGARKRTFKVLGHNPNIMPGNFLEAMFLEVKELT